MVANPNNCTPVENAETGKWVCSRCGYVMPTNFVKRCYRPHLKRSVENLREVIVVCAKCEHRTADGLCGKMITEGCGSCRSMEAFSLFQKSGQACPAGKFPATEVPSSTND